MKKKLDKEAREAAEKKLIREYFDNKKNGFFVEIGANDPTAIISQSWHLENQLNWTGILVEPNPIFAQQSTELRPRSTSFACACVESENQQEITLFVPLLNGKEMDVHAGINKNIDDFDYHQHKEVKVPCRTLNSLLNEVGATSIDLLSIDVEGAELQVLKGFDIEKYQPKLILLEDKHLYLTKHHYLKKYGYSLVKRTGFNFWYIPNGAKRPEQSILEKLKILKRMYISIWWKKLKFSIKHKSIQPLLRL